MQLSDEHLSHQVYIYTYTYLCFPSYNNRRTNSNVLLYILIVIIMAALWSRRQHTINSNPIKQGMLNKEEQESTSKV